LFVFCLGVYITEQILKKNVYVSMNRLVSLATIPSDLSLKKYKKNFLNL